MVACYSSTVLSEPCLDKSHFPLSFIRVAVYSCNKFLLFITKKLRQLGNPHCERQTLVHQ